MTTLRPDAFEEIFLKLEEESERRAMQVEDTTVSPNIPISVATHRAARQTHRHRGSVSISRFGHFEDTTQQTTLGAPQGPTAIVRGMATFAPLYRAQSDNHSRDSLSSMTSSFGGDDGARSTESEHVTQVHRIAGRQILPRSVGGILQRTLTLSRSRTCLSSGAVDTNVVIGVVVEDHVEESEPREAPSHTMAYVQAPCTLRPQSSRLSLPGAGGSWKSKAGELFKRKAQPRSSTLWTMTTTRES